jgi:nucleoporin POM152
MKPVLKSISSREIKAIETTRAADLQMARSSASRSDSNNDDYDEYDDDDDDETGSASARLQKSQAMVYIPIARPGTVRLDDVTDISGVDARIVYPSAITIAPCPRAEFRDNDVLVRGDNVRCAASDAVNAGGDITLDLDISGVPPLSLKWYKEINGRQEFFMVEGIQAGNDAPQVSPSAPQNVQVPLVVQARTLGTHVYALDSVTDALGNTEIFRSSNIQLATTNNLTKELTVEENTKTTRVLRILRRPAVSFKSCSLSRPTQMKIDSEVALQIGASEADAQDSPWDVTIKYQPPEIDSTATKRRLRPWSQTHQTSSGRRDLKIMADAPGRYTIVDVKGKYCEGDVLNPETCTVTEIAKPSAEISWKRIHEW